MNMTNSKKKLIVYVILTVMTIAVYWQVNQYDFVYMDDEIYVTGNTRIQSEISWEGIRWAFSTKYSGLWNPLIWLSLMFDYQLYGLNAGGYHITNLILHILSTLLLFWLFKRMTGTIWKSAFVAALFALHPLHVESVAWIAERKDVLSAFFWILTLCLYVYYTEKPALKTYTLSLFLFVCAIMSKPMVVTLPLIMILLDYWPLKRFQHREDGSNSKEFAWEKSFSRLLLEKIPFFVLSTLLVIITLYNPNHTKSEIFLLNSRLANATVSFVTYLGKTFWPYDMAPFYPFLSQIRVWQIMGAFLLIILISAAVVVMAKRMPYLFVGWMWFSIIIAPVIGIIQINQQAMTDRYHYLPSIGIGIMLAWGIPYLIKNINIRKKILFPVAITFLAIMAILAWKQCGYWKSTIEISKHTLHVTKNNYVVNYCLASTLATEGKMEDAIYYYNEAIRLNVDYSEAYNKRGTVYAHLGQYQRAIEDYSQVIRMRPDYPEAYNNRGLVYCHIDQYQSAINDFSMAISLKKDYADAYNTRGAVYLNQSNNELGCQDARKACEFGNCNTLQAAKVKGYCR